MILYDLTAAQGWGTTKQHGGGKYAEIVFKALCEKNASMVAMWDSKRWINEELIALCEKSHVEMIDISNMSIESIVKSNKVTTIYSALPQDNLINYKGCRIIATLHGLRELEVPNDSILLRYPRNVFGKIRLILKMILPNKYIKRKSLRKYHRFFENEKMRVVAVSNHTKYAIGTFFPDVNIDDVPVFYSPSTSNPIDAHRQESSEKYFLMVSANREEKNSLRAIMAFDDLLSKGKMNGFCMKITGIRENVFKFKLKNPDCFDFLGYVSENELNSLYANAYGFLYPSFSEGFGYPPLEAMRYGIPVLSSSHTSISEVCEGAALYFNPFSINEIENRLLQLSDKSIHSYYSAKGKLQYEKITKKQEVDLDGIVRYLTSFNTPQL